jgi:hypothetical protein
VAAFSVVGCGTLETVPALDTGADASADGTAPAPDDPYRAAVLADRPLAYWRLDEREAPVARDESGNGQDATYEGSVVFGEPGALSSNASTSVRLDGATAHIVVGDKFGFSNGAPFTFEMWVHPTKLVDYVAIFGKQSSYPARTGIELYIWSEATSGAAFEWYNNGTNAGGIVVAQPMASSEFSHLVISFDGSYCYSYLNGVRFQSNGCAPSIQPTSERFIWGSTSFGSDWFEGWMDELAVYGVALSDARVLAHYNASGRKR